MPLNNHGKYFPFKAVTLINLPGASAAKIPIPTCNIQKLVPASWEKYWKINIEKAGKLPASFLHS